MGQYCDIRVLVASGFSASAPGDLFVWLFASRGGELTVMRSFDTQK